MKSSRLAFGLMIAIAVVAGAWFYFPPLRLSYLVMTGHSPVCPWAGAVKAKSNITENESIKNRILQGSHFVKEESGLELWFTPEGLFWIPKGNRFVLPFNLAEMERHIYGTGEHFIHDGDVVIDCGASDGDFSRQAVHAGAKLVVSVEISPSSAECIRRNLASEIAANRVIVYPKGVWDKEDSLMLTVDDTNFAANTVVMQPESGHPSVKVPLTTIDKIVAELKLPRVDFIKMDVEGAEVKAIHGASDTIKRFKPRLSIATEHKPDDEVAIPAAVRQQRADYRMECGPCLEAYGHVRPDVLYFY